MDRRQAQSFFAQLARDVSQPREQWQKVSKWLDAMPLTARIEAVRYAERELKLDLAARVPQRGWIQAVLAGEATPQLYLVRNLSISHMRLGDREIVQLLKSPFLGPLVRLKLFGLGLHDSTVQALAACRQARHLRAINLTANALTSASIQVLTSSSLLPEVRELYLGRNAIDDDGALCLAQAPWSLHLRVVELRDNPISPAAQRTLQTSSFLQKAVVSFAGDDDGSSP